MKELQRIESVGNELIKRVCLLGQKSSERRKQRLFVVEGKRELIRCKQFDYEIVKVFICESFLTDDLLYLFSNEDIVIVTKKVYEKLAYRGSTEGVLALVKYRELSLSDLVLPDNPLLMIIEGVEKPGNIGAIMRSADAAKADAVILCDVPTDLYNPNIIRSSLGTLFNLQVVQCESTECINFLKQRGIQILTAQLQDSSLYYDVDMKSSTAIVMGTEATGLTDVWRKAADAHIRIPMLGQADSLNVSVSAAILLFEVVRQRMTVSS